jgi:hypothetical protein
MPIEIKEMHINIKVNYGNAANAPMPASKNMKQQQTKDDQKKMLDEYYDAVMEVINNKNQR